MSGGWQGTGRHAAALLALAARRASHAAASTSAPADASPARRLLQRGGPWLRQQRDTGDAGGSGPGGQRLHQRGISASAALAVETLPQEVEEVDERDVPSVHRSPTAAGPQQVRALGALQAAAAGCNSCPPLSLSSKALPMN